VGKILSAGKTRRPRRWARAPREFALPGFTASVGPSLKVPGEGWSEGASHVSHLMARGGPRLRPRSTEASGNRYLVTAPWPLSASLLMSQA